MKTLTLIDTFNDVVISRHRTLEGAVRAMAKHSRNVERSNGGPGFYIPKKIIGSDGITVDPESYLDLLNDVIC